MEIRFDDRGRIAAARVTEVVKAGQRADFDALPLQFKLAASHEALLCSVSAIAINCRRTAGRLFEGA